MKLLPRIILLFSLTVSANGLAQPIRSLADRIRTHYRIPALACAVISADSIFTLQVLGVRRINTTYSTQLTDRFHLGSNTKAITAFIAALLVKYGQLQWNTKFFALFPGLKSNSRSAYWDITLQDLLTFRARLPPYTYSFALPTEQQITGEPAGQRLKLAQYFLAQKPMKAQHGSTPSNADYVLAGLMLEQASGRSYQELVSQLGTFCQSCFAFDYPNTHDSLQVWGHDEALNPLPPAYHPKLNWLLAAGNIQVSLPDYARFVQFQLKGLLGQSRLLPAETFNQLLYGLPGFSFGWFTRQDKRTKHHVAFNTGNAGAFVTKVEIIKEVNRAYIIFTNAATPESLAGIDVLLDQLKERYGR